jgi:phosphoglycolate phosphatase
MQIGYPVKGVFIDLDGTLVDSAPDLHDALNQSLMQINYGPYDIQQTRQWIGNGLDLLLHRALTNRSDGQADETLLNHSRDLFLTQYRLTNGVKSRLYPGVSEALNYFTESGCKVVCVTNKNRAFAEPLLDRLGVLESFDLVLGGDDVSNKKPHPEMLVKALDSLALSRQECLMIGDSDNDVYAANRAGMDVVGVSYGYSQGVDLSELNILGMVDSLAELVFINN